MQMDFTAVQKVGSRMGTGTMIVLDDGTCPVGTLRNLERFFAQESCGWCTPCRDGLPWLASLLGDIEEGRGRCEDLDILEEHTRLIKMRHTYCAWRPALSSRFKAHLRFSDAISSAT